MAILNKGAYIIIPKDTFPKGLKITLVGNKNMPYAL